MSFGIFEAAASSEYESKLAANEEAHKLQAAIYDVKQQYGPFLFSSTGLDDFDNRVALVKEDMIRTVMAHIPPVTGTMRRVVKACKAEYKSQREAANADDNWVYNPAMGGGKQPGPGNMAPAGSVKIDANGMRTRTPEYDAWEKSRTFNPETGNPAYTQPKAFEPKTKIKASVHTADETGPALTPDGDFEAYLRSVEGVPVDVNFSGGAESNFLNDGAEDNFIKGSSVAVDMYRDWCATNGLRVASRKNLEHYARFVSEPEFRAIEAALVEKESSYERQLWAEIIKIDTGCAEDEPMVKDHKDSDKRDEDGKAERQNVDDGKKDDDKRKPVDTKGSDYTKNLKKPSKPATEKSKPEENPIPEWAAGAKRTAAGTSTNTGQEMQKAEQSIMDLLNGLAEDFQASVQPLQQALQAIEYAKSVQQQQNPMGVMPAGGLSVLPPPESPTGGPALGQPGFADPAAMGAGAPPAAPLGGDPMAAPAGDPAAALLGGGDAGAPPAPAGPPPGDPAAGAGPVPPSQDPKAQALLGSRRPLGEAGGPRQKQAWSGWGHLQPDNHHRTAAAAGWNWNERLNGYEAKANNDFPCECGVRLATPGFHQCKCGKQWNAYIIGSADDMRTGSAQRFLCREIPVREGVILEANKAAAEDESHEDESAADKVKHWLQNRPEHGGFAGGRSASNEFAEAFAAAWVAREAGLERRDVTQFDTEGDGEDPELSNMKQPPADWHHRDNRGKWTR